MKRIVLLLSMIFALGLYSCSDDFLVVESKDSIWKAITIILPKDYIRPCGSLDPLQWFDYFYSYNSLKHGVRHHGRRYLLRVGLTKATSPTCKSALLYSDGYRCAQYDLDHGLLGVNRSNIIIAKADAIEWMPPLRHFMWPRQNF
jgi:hypothetical protein